LTVAFAGGGVILVMAALASAQGGSIPDLRGSFNAWSCVGGTLAQCEANPTFPQTFTITSENFSTGAISGTGSAKNGDSWTVSGTISGQTVTLNDTNFKLETYSSTAVMTISANANTLTGTFSDSFGRNNQPTFAKRISEPTTPAPVLGRSVNVEPVSGEVFVKLPSGAHTSLALPLASTVESLKKGIGFIPLAQARQIPVGSILDTTAGVVRITTATASSTKGKLQSGDFGAGIFKLLQTRRQRGLTELDIFDVQSASQICASLGKARAAAKHLSSNVLGRLNSNAHGRFTTRGNYSATTVRGTKWSVTDRCDGTLTQVARGAVVVRDFRRHRNITVRAGQAYLAKAPGA
jgi:hypothetical protein